jgi:hypothetical protein
MASSSALVPIGQYAQPATKNLSPNAVTPQSKPSAENLFHDGAAAGSVKSKKRKNRRTEEWKNDAAEMMKKIMSCNPNDSHSILGVEPSADLDTIRIGYKSRLWYTHPAGFEGPEFTEEQRAQARDASTRMNHGRQDL